MSGEAGGEREEGAHSHTWNVGGSMRKAGFICIAGSEGGGCGGEAGMSVGLIPKRSSKGLVAAAAAALGELMGVSSPIIPSRSSWGADVVVASWPVSPFMFAGVASAIMSMSSSSSPTCDASSRGRCSVARGRGGGESVSVYVFGGGGSVRLGLARLALGRPLLRPRQQRCLLPACR